MKPEETDLKFIVRVGNEIYPVSGYKGCAIGEFLIEHLLLTDIDSKKLDYKFMIFSRPLENESLKNFVSQKYSFYLEEKERKESFLKLLDDSVYFIDYNWIEKLLHFFVEKSLMRKNSLFLLSLVYYYRVCKYLNKNLPKDKKIKLISYLHNRPYGKIFKTFLRKKNIKNTTFLHMHNSHLIANGTPKKLTMKWLSKSIDNLIFISKFLQGQYNSNSSNPVKSTIIHDGLCLVHDYFANNPEKLFANGKPKKISRWKYNLLFDKDKPPNLEIDNNIRLLFVGRILPEKGFEVLIDAVIKLVKDSGLIKFLRERDSKILLQVVGSPYLGTKHKSRYFESIKEKIDSLETQGIINKENSILKINFTGFIDRDEQAEQYALADIQVCPSVWEEPLGNVVYEGMVFRNVVIASESGGIPEMLDDKINGFLFKKRDSDELSRLLKIAMKKVLDNDKTFDSLCRDAKEKVMKNFTLKMQYAKLLNEYKKYLD